ncbi:single- stranded DNA-binding family protein [Caldisphaera sp.]|uniref:single- stranded DNA-binding family protein n=1 Tax=Caldisphaera sp. TaxID=2060322 RepID=UPI003D146608
MEILLKTGPVRMSGYALKLRRVANAAFRKFYKEKKVDPKLVNQFLTDLNKNLYGILVEKYNIPKDVIINIQLVLDLNDTSISIKDFDLAIYNKDEILSNNLTKEFKQLIKIEI